VEVKNQPNGNVQQPHIIDRPACKAGASENSTEANEGNEEQFPGLKNLLERSLAVFPPTSLSSFASF
jgi:hypothetical protein